MRRRALAPAALAWLAGCSAPVAQRQRETATAETPTGLTGAPDDWPPAAPREFRGAWVATVANIDWPSRPGLPAEVQRAEALALLERARTLGLNAIVLQVRPAGDAIYPSALEPWSEWLSGAQGRPPWGAGEAAWDPLAFWVAEAHRRALELHAWFNPYRARHSAARSPLAEPHIGVRQPQVVKRYGEQLWMDPGEPAAAAQLLAVVADVLRRYDIDAVHIDDYFYPYPVPGPGGGDLPFPDDEAWARYQLAGGKASRDAARGPIPDEFREISRDDWRRANVDTLVQALQRTVRETQPAARLGISPFGIGKPGRRPPGIAGFSQFDKLYADAERWLEAGWLDYWAPQLYWPIAREGQAFPVLLDYWLSLNTAQRHVWPGLYTSQLRAAANPWPAREFVEQIELLRSRAGCSGHIHFSLAALAPEGERLPALLQAGPYAQPALVPATPWLTAPPMGAPLLRAEAGRVQIEPAPGEAPRRWALWRRTHGDWRLTVLPAAARTIDGQGAQRVSLQAVDRIGRLGERAMIRL